MPASLEMTFEMKKSVREEEGSSTRTRNSQNLLQLMLNSLTTTTTTTKNRKENLENGKFTLMSGSAKKSDLCTDAWMVL